uniref:Uncharacterized protein n=1 Tax=Ditylenchus dipsaci TaxID=166011 RepID=A0A915EN54_9BILA
MHSSVIQLNHKSDCATMLEKISYRFLTNAALGIFVVGTGSIVVGVKMMQYKVRNLPHYQEAFTILSKHKEALDILGPPIKLGDVDVMDRRFNYLGEYDSRFKVPISGKLNAGFLSIYARRKSKDGEFKTTKLALY